MNLIDTEQLKIIIDSLESIGSDAKGAFVAYLVVALALPHIISAIVWVVGWFSVVKIGYRVAQIWETPEPKKPYIPTAEEAELLKISAEASKAETELAKAKRPIILDGSAACKELKKIAKAAGVRFGIRNDACYIASDFTDNIIDKLRSED